MRLLTTLLATAVFGSVFAEGAAPAPGVVPAAGEGEKKHELNDNSSLMAVVKRLDADKDGALSAAELATVKNEKLTAKLVALDTNKDGALDKAELEAAKAAWKGEKKDGVEKKDGDKPAEGGDKK